MPSPLSSVPSHCVFLSVRISLATDAVVSVDQQPPSTEPRANTLLTLHPTGPHPCLPSPHSFWREGRLVGRPVYCSANMHGQDRAKLATSAIVEDPLLLASCLRDREHFAYLDPGPALSSAGSSPLFPV